MSRIIEITTEENLADLPLRDLPDGEQWAGLAKPPRPAAQTASASPPAGAARLFRRAMAFVADAALVTLVVAGALLGAQLATGRGPRLSGIPWAAVFGVYFSFFAVVLPLLFFGQTLGLALAGLRVREGADRQRGLTLAEAAARWVGTLATAVSLGLPLAFTLQDPESPTLADRLSGRALMVEEVETS